MRELFPTLIGNRIIKDHIGRDISLGTHSHAYIIEGPHGSGKKTIARLIAASLSCEHRYDEDFPLSCGECKNCHKILNNVSPDVVKIGVGERSTIGVEAIREIRSGLYTTPNDSDNRTYIIESADKMTVQAQNALLLTLEEPPSFAVFILLCEDSSRLLETVRSRAMSVRCELFDDVHSAEYLRGLSGGEELEKNNLRKFRGIISISGGALGMIEELTREDDSASETVKCRDAAESLISVLLRGSAADIVKHVYGSIPKSSDSARLILICADNAVRDIIAQKRSGETDMRFFPLCDEAADYASALTLRRLIGIHNEILNAIFRLNSNVSPKTVFTDLSLKVNQIKNS